MSLTGNYCSAFRSGKCTRGNKCPLRHSHADGGAGTAHVRDSASPARTDSSASADSSWTWTSSSKSWADWSEELWASLPQSGGPKFLPVSRLGQSELPTFSQRLKDVPEFWCEAPHWLDPNPPPRAVPGDSDQDEEKAPKSKAAIRRRQRQVLERWVVMKNKNNDMSRPVLEAICKWSPCSSQLPPARRGRGRRSDDASPPPPPPPSPRKQRRNRDCDEEGGSGDEAEDADMLSPRSPPGAARRRPNTKVSL